METATAETEAQVGTSGKRVRPGLFQDKLTKIAIRQLDTSSEFKRPRMARVRKYEKLAAGKSDPRFRIQYDAVLPVFSGMVENLETEFDDPPFLKFTPDNPADYFSARKIQAAWENEAFSQVVTAKWPLKTRWDKHNAILSGRGILKYYSESDPEYRSVFDCVNYIDFHCQPDGGGHLENHMYAGQESIFRTQADLIEGAESGIYDRHQVKELIARASSEEYKNTIDSGYRERMARFFDLGLDPQQHSYVGQPTFNLVEWVTLYQGKRWYILFDPMTQIWIRFEPLKDLFSGELFPWFSWATHENDKVFWSKSYGDDFYPSAQTIVDFVQQEWTVRQKKLFGTKLYDPLMVVDPADLNTAQYQTDRLIEMNVPSGKKLSDGVYELPVGELGTATIDLVSWIESTAARQSGSQDLSQVASQAGGGKGAKANVVFAQIQAAQKRIGHKAHGYVECYNESGMRYIQGLKDNFTGAMPLKLIGPDGYETDELRRIDLNTKRQLNIKVTTKREEDQENVFGKKQKTDSLVMLKDSPNINSKKRDEAILRHIGGWPEEEILEFMDTQDYADKATLAKAELAIQQLLKGREPLINNRANIAFMEKIYNYALDHKEKLTRQGKYEAFLRYVDAHKMIASENMAKLAQDVKAGRKPAPGVGATPAGQQDARVKARAANPGGGAMVKGAAGVPMDMMQ